MRKAIPLCLCFFVVFLMVTSVWSQTQSNQVRTPTVASGWTNPAGIEVFSDGSYATHVGYPGDQSPSLIGQGFGFSIPANATVTGIKLEIVRLASPPPGYGKTSIYDINVFLLDRNGNQVGSNKHISGDWSGGLTDAVYGGNGDLWGLTTQTLNPTTINSPNFGAKLAVGFAGIHDYNHATAYVDGYRITVYYTVP